MDVYYSERLSQAFVIGPDELKKLISLLEKRIGTVSMRTNCIDKIERKFGIVKELIDYENSKSKRICRIYLSAQSDDHSKSTTIDFDDSFPLLGYIVSININGREDVVSRLKEEVLDVLSGMRPWYSWIARVDLFTTFSIVFIIVLCIILPIFVLFEWIPVSDSPSSNSGIVKRSAISTLFLIGTILCFWGLHRLRGFLFPKLVFTIGQGESRFRLLEKVRWIVVSFGASFAVGLVGLMIKDIF